MTESVYQMRRYLIREQGWDEETVRSLSKSELEEVYNHYHE